MAQIIVFPNKQSKSIDVTEELAGPINNVNNYLFDSIQEIYLSNTWRVIDDGTQWLIQSKKPNGWKTKSCCITRDELLQSLMQYGTPASPDSIAMIKNFPPTYRFGFGRKGSPS